VKHLVAIALVLVGCKYPDPGAADDQPPMGEAGIGDGNDADDGAVVTTCPEPMSIDTMTVLPGQQVADFTPTEAETFAISMVTGGNPGYTVAPLGVSYNPTDIPNPVIGVTLSPSGDELFFTDTSLAAGSHVQRATNAGTPADWNPPEDTGLPDGVVGRPTADGSRIVIVVASALQEYELVGTTWTFRDTYNPSMFGHDATSGFTSGGLSPDGLFLVYTISGPVDGEGVNLRVRGGGIAGTFKAADSAYGRGLVSGDYRNPTLTSDCTRLYLFNITTGRPERYAVHP
jgi:hypothetical protein